MAARGGGVPCDGSAGGGGGYRVMAAWGGVLCDGSGGGGGKPCDGSEGGGDRVMAALERLVLGREDG
jgi:hypothetical protein